MMKYSLLLSVVLVCSSSVAYAQVTAKPVSGQCYLQGFNLAGLTSVEYWTFELSNENQWLIPIGVAADEIESVVVYMAVCKPLPTTICNHNAASSICQRVTLTNQTVYDIEMGSYDDTDSFKILGAGNGTGFYEVQESRDAVNVTGCNLNVISVVTWKGSDKSWSSDNIDVTNRLLVVVHVVDECLYNIQFEYDGANYEQPTLAPGSCTLDGYDTSTIARQPYWFAKVPHTVCYNGSEDQTCYVVFSFCHTLPGQGNTHFNLNDCYYQNAAVCQIGHRTDGGEKVLEYSMGKFQSYTRFYENVNSVYGGFYLDLTNGSKPDNSSVCKTFLKTRILLVCNSTAVWPEDGDLTNIIHSIYDEQCQYVLEIPYIGACIAVGPIYDQPSPVGWIFIGLFLLVSILYVLIGMAFQYFVKGARGLDIIPNYKFWTMVASLVSEGFRYTLDILTCFKFKAGITKPTGSSGVQYDQI